MRHERWSDARGSYLSNTPRYSITNENPSKSNLLSPNPAVGATVTSAGTQKYFPAFLIPRRPGQTRPDQTRPKQPLFWFLLKYFVQLSYASSTILFPPIFIRSLGTYAQSVIYWRLPTQGQIYVRFPDGCGRWKLDTA